MTADLTSLHATLQDASPARLGTMLAPVWRSQKEQLFEKDLPGEQIAEHLAAIMDELVRVLASALQLDHCAVVAVGGYAQGRLAPYSDIDILILTDDHADGENITRFLHALWDGGINLSQSVHTLPSALQTIREDVIARTAFLDARLLWGQSNLLEEFQAEYEKLRESSIADFICAKLLERQSRHDEGENSRYAIEPDVKNGRGGIRDIQTLYWLDRYVNGPSLPSSTMPPDRGILSPKEKARMRSLNDFLWSVRVNLHWEMGRADNKLHFAVQDQLAARLGFRSSGSVRRVERFMRYYFLAVEEVCRLTRTAASETIDKFVPVGPHTQTEDVLKDYPELRLLQGRVTFVNPATIDTPRPVLELFHAAGVHELGIHPEAFDLVSRMARRLNFRQLQAPALRERFAAIIRDSVKLEPLLREMTECGLLGRILPSFGAIVGKVEYGIFRRFTLDDHCLRSLAVLDQIVAGETPELGDETLTARARQHRTALAMALLLQEARHALSNPTDAKIRRRISFRLGVLFNDKAFGELVAFTVLNHTLLIRTAARRNFVEPLALRKVATDIGSVERLDVLSVFTLCRQRFAGVGSWEEYSHRDVDLLTTLIRLRIEGGDEIVETHLNQRSEVRRNAVAQAIGEHQMAPFDALLSQAGHSFWSYTDESAAIRVAKVIAKAETAQEADVAVLELDDSGTLNVLVYCDDRPGVMAACTGLTTMAGGSVFGASNFSYTYNDRFRGVVMLQVNQAGTPPLPFTQFGPVLEELEGRLLAVAKGESPDIKVPAPRIGDPRTHFDITPIITIDDQSSEEALIVEVIAKDRPGLLYLLTNYLTEIGVDIVFSLVATYGHRAVDTFYLRDHPGYKITDPRRIEAVRRQLLRAFGEEIPQEVLSLGQAGTTS